MYRSLAVPNPRISADQPSLARGVARSSDREDSGQRITEKTVRQETCAQLTTDSHINGLPLSRERRFVQTSNQLDAAAPLVGCSGVILIQASPCSY